MKRVVRWLAVLLATVGCGIWVWNGVTGEDIFDWLNSWMAAPLATLSVLPVVFSLTSGPAKSQFRGAPIAFGTLVDTRRTGLTVNDQPQLDLIFDVETPDGHTFRGTARQIVDLTELALLTPGLQLPVHYRPDRMDGKIALATDVDPEKVEAMMYQSLLARGKLTPKQVQIARYGVEAQAVVLQMNPTGQVIDGESEIDLLLRVTRPDGSRFDTWVRKNLSSVAIPSVQPGMVIRAKYLPHDEQDVGIEVRAG